MDPLYYVLQLAKTNPPSLVVERFRHITQSDGLSVRYIHSIIRSKPTRGCNKRRNNWEGHDVLSPSVPREDLDVPLIRMSEETVYVLKLGQLLNTIADAPREELVNNDFCEY